jgi:segregation and condensation protein A
MTYEIKLDIFEGPLDLLLYLIKKNEIDVYDIPIALITEQYLQYIRMMRALNLDLAGEYLVLASTLLLIKSKMLLPEPPIEGEQPEEEDPRAELVRQLLEYQAYKEASLTLAGRPLLERDVFKQASLPFTLENAEEEAIVEATVFDLVQAFQRIVTSLGQDTVMDIDTEKLSLTDRIHDILEKLIEKKSITFEDLILERRDRRWIIYTFLAVLELMKTHLIRAYQSGLFGQIWIRPAVKS